MQAGGWLGPSLLRAVLVLHRVGRLELRVGLLGLLREMVV
jgi:hypothetical protein